MLASAPEKVHASAPVRGAEEEHCVRSVSLVGIEKGGVGHGRMHSLLRQARLLLVAERDFESSMNRRLKTRRALQNGPTETPED